MKNLTAAKATKLIHKAHAARDAKDDAWLDLAAALTDRDAAPALGYSTLAELASAEFGISIRQWHRAAHAGRVRAAVAALTPLPASNIGANPWEDVTVTDAPNIANRLLDGDSLTEAIRNCRTLDGLYEEVDGVLPVADDLPTAFHALALAVKTLAFHTDPAVLADGTAVIYDAAQTLYTILDDIQPSTTKEGN